MRFISVLAAGLLISSTAIAQSQTFAIHPGSTSYTSRGNLGTGSGETLMGLHSAYWQGLGDDGSACSRTQLGLVDQDQNSNTQESFHLVIRSGTDSNGPGTGSSDVLYRYGPFNMPSTPTGSINAWIQTVTLGTPAVVRCGDFHSWGAELTPSTNWSADGMSTHTSFSRTNRNMQFCHLNSEPHGYYFTAGSSRATADTGNARTWRYRMGLSAARNVLQMGSTGNVLGGGTNQRYGMGGMFPNNTETLSARTTSCPAGATVQTYVSFGYFPGGIALFPGTSRLYLNPAFFMALVSSTAAGGSETHVLGPVPTPAAQIGPIAFQTAIISGGVAALSNGNSTTILP